MIKWFLYIVLLMVSAPRLSSAQSAPAPAGDYRSVPVRYILPRALSRDTLKLKHQQDDDKKKIKEVAKPKKQSKPEKVEEIDPATGKPMTKPKRQRRPEGLERPPEIPRRNNN